MKMITSISGRTLATFANIGQTIAMLYEAHRGNTGQTIHIRTDMWNTIGHDIEHLHQIASELCLDATLQSIEHATSLWNRASIGIQSTTISANDAERLTWTLQSLRENFSTQMLSRLVLVLETKFAHYLTSTEPAFGFLVEDIFPMAGEEISEAAKCLALQRPTAVVFHLMRAMELAVQRMAETLGRDNCNEKVWGIILSDMHSAIEAMPKGRRRDSWSACHSHLYHVKQAWRNDTMHPKTTYTEAQAETVFAAVNSFMSHLAELVSETERPQSP